MTINQEHNSRNIHVLNRVLDIFLWNQNLQLFIAFLFFTF